MVFSGEGEEVLPLDHLRIGQHQRANALGVVADDGLAEVVGEGTVPVVLAAEACHQVPEGHIRLRAAVVRDSLVIETENPAPPEEPRKRRRIPELERGVGTHILRELAEKYDGSLTQETENGRFLATLTLTLKGETQVCPAS